VKEIEYTVTKEDQNKNILLNIVDDGGGDDKAGGTIGWVQFPPNALKPGWNVTIRASDHQKTSSSGSNDCGEDSDGNQSLEAASVPLEIEVTDSKGRPVRHFSKDFQISLYGLIDQRDLAGSSSVCLGYAQSKDDSWKCDTEASVNATGTDSVYLVGTNSDHLTSFAVLLGSASSGRNGCGGWQWIPIASLAIIGGAFVCFTLVIVTFLHWRRFRAVIRGRNEEAAMRQLEEAFSRSRPLIRV